MSTEDEPTGLPELSDEAKVGDLLPPDVELPPPPTKKIAERRVGGWVTSARLFERRAFRPAGNSRRFWRKIEDDDPFLAKPTGRRVPQEGGHALYPQERLQRMPEPPKVSRPTEHAPPPPRPQRVAPPPAYTEEPRPAPQPRSVPRPAPQRPAPPPPAAAEPPPPTVDRRPPIVPHNPGRKRPAGRMNVSGQRAARQAPQAPEANVRHRLTNSQGRSATEIRQEREKWREQSKGPPPPPKLRSYDDVLSILGDLKASQELHEAGITGTTSADIVDTPPPRPKPQRPAPPPQPPPQQAAPPPRPEPPKPKPPAERPINRSPSGRGGSSGGLDDLFGGGPNEGRMRIPRRSKPTAGDDDD